jgi:hypothetical protein
MAFRFVALAFLGFLFCQVRHFVGYRSIKRFGRKVSSEDCEDEEEDVFFHRSKICKWIEITKSICNYFTKPVNFVGIKMIVRMIAIANKVEKKKASKLAVNIE